MNKVFGEKLREIAIHFTVKTNDLHNFYFVCIVPMIVYSPCYDHNHHTYSLLVCIAIFKTNKHI